MSSKFASMIETFTSTFVSDCDVPFWGVGVVKFITVDAQVGAIDAASITEKKAIKIAMLHHLPGMLLHVFIMPLPLFAVCLSVAVRIGCASVHA